METIPETGQKQSVVHNTFVLERSFSQPPQSVFAAFADPAKKRRWLSSVLAVSSGSVIG
jgi:uncharacterized protein YndB with AHSA1/START domain